MSDLQVLQKISQENFPEFLEITLKSLSQKQSSDLVKQFKSFCDKSTLQSSELECVIKLLHQGCKDAVKRGKPLNMLLDEFRKLGMNEDQIEAFSNQWEKISSSLIQTTAADTIPINPLIDMEWKFGAFSSPKKQPKGQVTSASSQLNTVGNVFLQMKLEVDQGNGRTKTVFFELQLSEFYSFLYEMERARASLDYLS